jgi:hypothetical protein
VIPLAAIPAVAKALPWKWIAIAAAAVIVASYIAVLKMEVRSAGLAVQEKAAELKEAMSDRDQWKAAHEQLAEINRQNVAAFDAYRARAQASAQAAAEAIAAYRTQISTSNNMIKELRRHAEKTADLRPIGDTVRAGLGWLQCLDGYQGNPEGAAAACSGALPGTEH